MNVIQIGKNILRGLDKFSPYPLFYLFIMTKAEKVIFDRAIRKSNHYLEFGLGGSTLRAITQSKAKIYTVESSPQWIAVMRKYWILKYFENKRVLILPVDIGPTRDWGHPCGNEQQALFPAYSSAIFEVVDPMIIDLALVDGRFRVACALQLILQCHHNDHLNILFHDFWIRERYHVVLKYLDVIERADNIGLFKIKANIDLGAVKQDYDCYKFNSQ